MEIVRVAGVAVTAAFAAAALRRMRPEAGMGLAVAGGVILLMAALSQVQTVAGALQQLCEKAQLQPAYVRTLFKTVGICFLTDFAADVCRDVQETGLAQRVETVGRMMILAVATPVLASLLGKLLELAP